MAFSKCACARSDVVSTEAHQLHIYVLKSDNLMVVRILTLNFTFCLKLSVLRTVFSVFILCHKILRSVYKSSVQIQVWKARLKE
jgi:hypothetical protein